MASGRSRPLLGLPGEERANAQQIFDCVELQLAYLGKVTLLIREHRVHFRRETTPDEIPKGLNGGTIVDLPCT